MVFTVNVNQFLVLFSLQKSFYLFILLDTTIFLALLNIRLLSISTRLTALYGVNIKLSKENFTKNTLLTIPEYCARFERFKRHFFNYYQA